MTPLVAYLLLFVAVGVGFIFVHLMAGKFIRPSKMDAEKGTIYECGEPTVGTAWVQFDLRFYVVALLFVIFDVEVAFFFPWAEVFGRANALASVRHLDDAAAYNTVGERALALTPRHDEASRASLDRLTRVRPEDLARLAELRQKRSELQQRTPPESLSREEGNELSQLEEVVKLGRDTVQEGRSYSWLALGEILLFFGVLLVGFASLWKRGDLAWVRSVAAERQATQPPAAPPPAAPASAPARALVEAGGQH